MGYRWHFLIVHVEVRAALFANLLRKVIQCGWFELVAADQPGLLSKIGRVFIEQGIDIEAAKIMTIGERAEDVFYICRESGGPLDEPEQAELRSALLARIDSDLG